jgi:hypothetical protein
MRLWHYTLNTADSFDCSFKKFDPSVLNLLQPLAIKAKEEGRIQAPLPSPFEDHIVKITLTDGAALFDLWDCENQLLTTNALAWTTPGQELIWPLFEDLYLRLAKNFNALSVLRVPNCPKNLPWLATLALPNPGVATWMSDFEQCLSLEIIRQTARKPKGGKNRGKP